MATVEMTRALAQVARLAQHEASLSSALRTEIRRAHEHGASLRTIAAAAGLSRETVRRIVKADG
jgi:IS30 family transposase